MHEDDWTLDIPAWVYLLSVISIQITLAAAAYIYLGSVFTTLFAVVAVLATIAWYNTTYHSPRRRSIFPLFIVVVIAILFQGLEQWSHNYPQAMQSLFPSIFTEPVRFDETIFLSIFVLAATTVFLLGGFGILFHHHLGNFTAWFVMLYAVIQSCFIFGLCLLVADGPGYMPGLIAAPLCFALGLWGSWRLCFPAPENKEASA